jgi:preprotein translocase subunit Sss1
LKQAGIGLAIIGLSWFVVSIIFRVISGSSANVDG